MPNQNKNRLEVILHAFLQKHYDPDHPVLLALSGGPDSLTLLYLLLDYREKFPLNLGIAHIDHNWREESGSEAHQLELLARRFNLPFYLKVIYPKNLSGNLEAASRDERLRFYQELCKLHGFQAVLLAHHADDQAETVLKRVLEGANLSYLSGLQEVSKVEDVTLWRPLLSVPKAEIVEWGENRGLAPFIDSTNYDQRFLRGKMRTKIIPELTSSFGKEISGSLCYLASEAQELRRYFSGKLQPYLDSIQQGPLGSLLDLSENCPPSAFEMKYLLREWLQREGFGLSRTQLNDAYRLITEKKANRRLAAAGRILYIDRGRVFLTDSDDCSSHLSSVPLIHGDTPFGRWAVKVEPINEKKTPLSIGWQSVWKGYAEAYLPAGEYQIGLAKMNYPYPGKSSIGKWWNDHKIPAFLRPQIPVIWKNDEIHHEFLTGSRRDHPIADTKWIHISLLYF